jgi:hypothetical protein
MPKENNFPIGTYSPNHPTDCDLKSSLEQNFRNHSRRPETEVVKTGLEALLSGLTCKSEKLVNPENL